MTANGACDTPTIEVQCPKSEQYVGLPGSKPCDLAENDSECDSGTGPIILVFRIVIVISYLVVFYIILYTI